MRSLPSDPNLWRLSVNGWKAKACRQEQDKVAGKLAIPEAARQLRHRLRRLVNDLHFPWVFFLYECQARRCRVGGRDEEAGRSLR